LQLTPLSGVALQRAARGGGDAALESAVVVSAHFGAAAALAGGL
jgi:hypothetical protein